MTRLNRRRFLTVSGVTLGGAAVGASFPAAAAHAAPTTSTWQARASINGWPVLDDSAAQQFRIEGSNLSVRLAPAAAPALLYVARRFHCEIESELEADGVTGHTVNRQVRARYESTYLSGSGIAIRPLHYPMGAKNGFFDEQKIVIRDILADCHGLVAWGGDLDPVKESHFHITTPPTSSRYRKLVAKLEGWEVEPGKGAGTINAFTPARRKRVHHN